MYPNKFHLVQDSTDKVVLRLDAENYFKGNILRYDMFMELFVDNYYSLVSLNPFFKVISTFMSFPLVSKVIVYGGDEETHSAIISKKSTNIFNDTQLI